MNTGNRSAMLQMRVSPAIKYASEHILHRIGLSMTEAMELFLRRVIVDEKLPFEIVALDAATLVRLLDEARVHEHAIAVASHPRKRVHPRRRSQGGG